MTCYNYGRTYTLRRNIVLPLKPLAPCRVYTKPQRPRLCSPRKNVQTYEVKREKGNAEYYAPGLRKNLKPLKQTHRKNRHRFRYICKFPGDGSAREQAASNQKVLGGWANFARSTPLNATAPTLLTGVYCLS